MRDKISINGCSCTRRDFLRRGLHGVGVGAALPMLLRNTSSALAATDAADDDPGRILVVVELSGGNDGLNTVVPYSNDAYYRARPNLGIPENDLLKLDDDFGFHPSFAGMEELYKDGNMAVVHGCGYDNPILSHFVSMSYWHTGVPNGGDPYGWVGRMADATCPESRKNLLVNIANQQTLAMRSRVHTPLVFNNPNNFRRSGNENQKAVFEHFARPKETVNDSLDFLNKVGTNAKESAAFVREASASYRTSIDYGVLGGLGGDLRKVAALIDRGMPTQIYYVSYQGNSFDTHVHQADLHTRLLMYTSDAIRGFMKDMDRIGRGDDVAMMVFTEFGRRVEENASLGTDHGTATPMFVLGNRIDGGFYGDHPSLETLDDGNLIKTTDFRRVYASIIEEWMQYEDSKSILKKDFEPLGLMG